MLGEERSWFGLQEPVNWKTVRRLQHQGPADLIATLMLVKGGSGEVLCYHRELQLEQENKTFGRTYRQYGPSKRAPYKGQSWSPALGVFRGGICTWRMEVVLLRDNMWAVQHLEVPLFSEAPCFMKLPKQ